MPPLRPTTPEQEYPVAHHHKGLQNQKKQGRVGYTWGVNKKKKEDESDDESDDSSVVSSVVSSDDSSDDDVSDDDPIEDSSDDND